MEQKSNSNLIKIFGVVFVVIIAAVVGWQVLGNSSKKEQVNIQPDPTSEGSVNVEDQNGERNRYRNGKYSALGNYQSPAQLEEVEINLTVADGVITDGEFIAKATHPTSKKLQGMFAQGFKEAVIGKNIDEVNVIVVNGSSLTPKGFMDALEKIKTQAQS